MKRVLVTGGAGFIGANLYITLAKALLGGWAPTIELRSGLEKTIEYFRR